MEPIINPWFIYLLNVLDVIKADICMLWWFGVLGGLGYTLYKITQECELIIPKKLITILLIVIVTFWFIPDKNTIIQMYVAKSITPNNVEKVLKTGKEFKNELKKDVFDIIDKINKKGEGKE